MSYGVADNNHDGRIDNLDAEIASYVDEIANLDDEIASRVDEIGGHDDEIGGYVDEISNLEAEILSFPVRFAYLNRALSRTNIGEKYTDC